MSHFQWFKHNKQTFSLYIVSQLYGTRCYINKRFCGPRTLEKAGLNKAYHVALLQDFSEALIC